MFITLKKKKIFENYPDNLSMLRLLGFGGDIISQKVKNVVTNSNDSDLFSKMSKKGGVYTKLAQAMKLSDSEHEAFNACTPLNPEETKERLQTFIETLDDIQCEPTPSWFGSTAQVHRACLKNSTSVVFKVKYVNIEKILQEDLDLLCMGIKIFDRQQKLNIFTQDMKNTILNELDYKREIKFITYINDICTENNMNIEIPKVYPEFCNDNIICMSQIMGQTLNGWKKNKSQQDLNKLGENICTFVYTLMNQFDLVYADVHWSNFLINENEQLCVVDFGSIAEVPRSYRQQRFNFHHACVNKDFDQFEIAAVDMELFNENIKYEDKVLIFNYFICHLRPFAVETFTFDTDYLNTCRDIPFHILKNLNVRSHLYGFTKLSYNMNALLCALNCTSNFKQIIQKTMADKKHQD